MATYRVKPGFSFGIARAQFPQTVELDEAVAQPFLDKLERVEETPAPIVDYANMRVAELREIAMSRGIPVTGLRKTELIEALS